MKGIEINWNSYKGEEMLVFNFNDKLTKTDAESAISVWKQEFAKNPGIRKSIVWNCLNMKSYDPGSRIVWQKAMDEQKGDINTIYLISTSKTIKLGASLLNLFSHFTIKNLSSMDDLHEKQLVES